MRRVSNNVKTVFLLAVLGGFFVIVGAWLGGTTGATLGLTIGVAMSFGTYWFSDRLALRAARAQPVSEQEAPWLYRIVEDLTTRAGMPMPRLYITPDAQPNAFATGRNERHAAVAVTAGIVDVLDESELRAVLAHEMAHVRNHDILIGSIAAALAMAITFAARVMMFGAAGSRNRRANPLALVAMMILAPLAATIVQLALSRSRESEADWSGAELIGTGIPLARALQKLERGAQVVPMDVEPARSAAYMVNPLTGRRIAFAGLFATHPPIEERIAALFDEERELAARR